MQKLETVLLVDDDENWCFIAERLLKKMGACNKIIRANSGLSAITQLRLLAKEGKKMPDLIFLDLKMPVMDGFEFLEEVKKSPELDMSNTRIFVCSSSQHPKDKERAYLYPIAGFISKPLTIDILREILK